MPMDAAQLKEFATNYTAAWCSRRYRRKVTHRQETREQKAREESLV